MLYIISPTKLTNVALFILRLSRSYLTNDSVDRWRKSWIYSDYWNV